MALSLENISISDTQLRVEVIEACTSCDIDLSVDGQTEISLEFTDVDFQLLKSGVFQRKMPLNLTYSDPDTFDGLRPVLECEVAVIETASSPAPMGIKVSARSFAVQKFKRTKTAITRRNISPTDWLIAEANLVRASVLGEPTSRRSQISRVNNENKQTSTWDVMSELAGELGFLFFECQNVFYFGKPSWLISREEEPRWELVFGSDTITSRFNPLILDIPNCRSSENANDAATVGLLVDRTYGVYMRPGQVAQFSGVPFFEGRYMISSVNFSLLSQSEPVSVELVTPIDPEKPKDGKSKKKKAVTEQDGAEKLIDGTALDLWRTSS